MIPTWEPIASVDVNGANSVDFTSISADYTDLILVYHTNAASQNDIWVRYNSDSGSNYSYVLMSGYDAASTTSFRNNNQDKGLCDFYATPSSTARALGMVQIMSYANTNFFKTALCATARQDRGTDRVIHTWRSTAAITSISVFITGITVTGTFALYGVGNANLAQQATGVRATGGDEVFIANGYKHHIFRSSGSLSVSQGGDVEYLVVAGGGGGGQGYAGGGGGAGGFRSSIVGGSSGGGSSSESALTVSPGSVTVTVGAGGANNASGSNSVFGSITSTGGGRGGTYQTAGTSGGSGGGGGGNDATVNVGGSGTATQGYAGGSSGSGYWYAGGGGGGAGAVGSNGTGVSAGAGEAAAVGGAGGAGVSSSASGSSVTYAVGGAGVRYNGPAPSAGTANSGNGGGGGGLNTTAGAAGGSGIVIVRYPVS